MVYDNECDETNFALSLLAQLEYHVRRCLSLCCYVVKCSQLIRVSGGAISCEQLSPQTFKMVCDRRGQCNSFDQLHISVPQYNNNNNNNNNILSNLAVVFPLSLFAGSAAISSHKNESRKKKKNKNSFLTNSTENNQSSQSVQKSTCTKEYKSIKGKISANSSTRMNLQSSISCHVAYHFVSKFVPEKVPKVFKVLLFAFTILCSVLDLSTGIKIHSVTVPPHQKSGEPVNLECNYDLEGDTLYSVKWYRGSNEFFRYLPAEEKNPMQVFDLPGVVVNTALSDSRRVTLRSVSRDSSGKYKCEVSADFPSFHTVSKAAEMLVVDISNSVPNITGGRIRYHVGDEVHVNCTSAKSRPAASLMWYINDKQARSDELVEYAPEQDEDGLETSRLGLKFVVGAKDFPKGVLKIRCTATVAAVYWNSAEEAVEGQLPQTSPALESKGVYTGGSWSIGVASKGFTSLALTIQLLLILTR